MCILADKEETGSDGVSGMKSEAFEWFMNKLCKATGSELDDCFANSLCVSADVTAAFDPNYPRGQREAQRARLNYGVGLSKFTGARGKSSTNDAPAELVAYMRGILDRHGVQWQMCELGKVDQGGGGTVAMYMGNRNIATIDAGVPVLSMHAPFEIVSQVRLLYDLPLHARRLRWLSRADKGAACAAPFLFRPGKAASFLCFSEKYANIISRHML